MIASFIIAMVFKFGIPGYFSPGMELILGVLFTTTIWVATTFMTPPVDRSTLISFYQLIKPHSRGWKPVIEEGLATGKLDESDINVGQLPQEFGGMVSGIFLVYGLLFSIGWLIYANFTAALIGGIVSCLAGLGLWYSWKKT